MEKVDDTKLEKQQCSKCKVFRTPIGFSDGRTQCNLCLESKRAYREKNRETLREKAREYYHLNKEKKLEYNKHYQHQMVECSTCQVWIQKRKMKTHEQTKTHLHNLINPDNPKLTYKQQHEEKLKQQEQHQKQVEAVKQARRQEHQKTIDYLNENFPTYPYE